MRDVKILREKVKDLKVLFVDDNKEVREGTSFFLKKFFNNVVVCSDGDQGLDEFSKNGDFNIVITDIRMPKMNGDIMAQKIKEINSEIFVVFLTASRAIQDIGNKLCHLSFKKPISFEDMKFIMQTVEKLT